jgi:hypothetical protein
VLCLPLPNPGFVPKKIFMVCRHSLRSVMLTRAGLDGSGASAGVRFAAYSVGGVEEEASADAGVAGSVCFCCVMKAQPDRVKAE